MANPSKLWLAACGKTVTTYPAHDVFLPSVTQVARWDPQNTYDPDRRIVVFSDNNRVITNIDDPGNIGVGTAESYSRATVSISAGKRYFEIVCGPYTSDLNWFAGIMGSEDYPSQTGPGTNFWLNISTKVLYRANGQIWYGASSVSSGPAVVANDVLGFAVDMNTKLVGIYRNGVFVVSLPFTQDIVYPLHVNGGGGDTVTTIHTSPEEFVYPIPLTYTAWSDGDFVGVPVVAPGALATTCEWDTATWTSQNPEVVMTFTNGDSTVEAVQVSGAPLSLNTGLVRGVDTITSGKYYFEISRDYEASEGGIKVGIVSSSATFPASGNYAGLSVSDYVLIAITGGASTIFGGSAGTGGVSDFTTFGSGRIGVAVDMTAHSISFYLNNVLISTPPVTFSFSSANALLSLRNPGDKATLYDSAADFFYSPPETYGAMCNPTGFDLAILYARYNGTGTDSSIYHHSVSTVGSPTFNLLEQVSGQGCYEIPNSTALLSSGGGTMFKYDSVQGFGTEDFTIEFWAFPTYQDTAYRAWLSTRTGGGDYTTSWTLYSGKHSTGLGPYNWSLRGGDGSTAEFNMAALSDQPDSLFLNEWQYVTFVRAGQTVKYFVNGILRASISLPSPTSLWGTSAPKTLAVGNFIDYPDANVGMAGRIDELIITKGLAKYSANFIPPGSPYKTLMWQKMEVFPLVDSISGYVMDLAFGSTPTLITSADGNGIQAALDSELSLTGAYPTSGGLVESDYLSISVDLWIPAATTDYIEAGITGETWNNNLETSLPGVALQFSKNLTPGSIDINWFPSNFSAGVQPFGAISLTSSDPLYPPMDTWIKLEYVAAGGKFQIRINGVPISGGVNVRNSAGTFISNAELYLLNDTGAPGFRMDNLKIVGGRASGVSGAQKIIALPGGASQEAVSAPTIGTATVALTTYSLTAPSYAAPSVVSAPLIENHSTSPASNSTSGLTSETMIISGTGTLSSIVWAGADANSIGGYGMKILPGGSFYPSFLTTSTFQAEAAGYEPSGGSSLGLTCVFTSKSNLGVAVSIVSSIRDGVIALNVFENITSLVSLSDTYTEPVGPIAFKIVITSTTIDLYLQGILKLTTSRSGMNTALGAEAINPEVFIFQNANRAATFGTLSFNAVG